MAQTTFGKTIPRSTIRVVGMNSNSDLAASGRIHFQGALAPDLVKPDGR
jgi:hypothetical protein